MLQVRFFGKTTQVVMSIQRVYCGALLGSVSMGEYRKQDWEEKKVGLLCSHSKASTSKATGHFGTGIALQGILSWGTDGLETFLLAMGGWDGMG